MRKWSPFFWFAALLDPVDSLDLVDNNGAPDHGKILPFLTILAAIALHVLGNPLPLPNLIVLVSAAFGYNSWRTFLKAKMYSRTETAVSTNTTVTTVNHQIAEKRDASAGIDPAP
jgi:hypothetical protein